MFLEKHVYKDSCMATHVITNEISSLIFLFSYSLISNVWTLFLVCTELVFISKAFQTSTTLKRFQVCVHVQVSLKVIFSHTSPSTQGTYVLVIARMKNNMTIQIPFRPKSFSTPKTVELWFDNVAFPFLNKKNRMTTVRQTGVRLCSFARNSQA